MSMFLHFIHAFSSFSIKISLWILFAASYPSPDDVIAVALESDQIITNNEDKVSNLERLSRRLGDIKSKIEKRPEALRRINATSMRQN